MRGLGGAGIGEVDCKVGMRGVEVAGGIAQIGLFCDRQRDDAGPWIGHRVEQCRRVFRRNKQRQDRAHDAQALHLPTAHGQGVEPVLRLQRIARIAAAQRRADNAPAGLAGAEAVIDIDGLMGAVESADAQMHYAGRNRSAVIVGFP